MFTFCPNSAEMAVYNLSGDIEAEPDTLHVVFALIDPVKLTEYSFNVFGQNTNPLVRNREPCLASKLTCSKCDFGTWRGIFYSIGKEVHENLGHFLHIYINCNFSCGRFKFYLMVGMVQRIQRLFN